MAGLGSTDTAFRRLWAGTAASNLADGLVVAAAPLLAASLTRDPLLVSGLMVAQQLPWFVFTLFAGVIVDRVDRRRLLVAANVLRALALSGLAVAITFGVGHLAVLYLAMFALGLAETIVDTAALAVLPRLVSRDRLERANGRIFATQSVLDELVGPPLGGVLFAVSATVAFLSGSVAFALAAGVLALLPGDLRPAHDDGEPSAEASATGVRQSIAEGMRWFWANRLIRTVAIMAGISNLFSAATLAVLVLLATGPFGVGPTGYGLLLTGGAVGGIAGGLVADRLVARLGSGRVILVSNLMHAASYAVLAVSPSALPAGVALGSGSFAAMIGNVVVITLRQAAIPDHLLGRVTSAYRLIALGAVPLGGLLGGVAAGQLGLRAPFYLGAGTMAVLAVVLAPVLTTEALDRATGRAPRPPRDMSAPEKEPVDELPPA